jgi:hypothetical protein
MKFIPRLYEWYLAAIALVLALSFIAPQNLPVVAYKAALVAVAVVLASILERKFLPQPADQTARAIVMAAVILGMTLGI